ncbi:MAG: ABC transporter ATP-binding protein, partial [Candidatus Bathyarchaeia archaeon]
VDEVGFNLQRGQTVAIVGESGCGKSSTANAVLRLLPRNVNTYSGKVVLEGRNLMEIKEDEFRREVAWKRISMVFQGAMNSLNPVLKVGDQIMEPLIVHNNATKAEARQRLNEVLQLVRLPTSMAELYPHELSGGMKQRAVIAMSLIANPQVVILDEPTSALDVITQANIMNTLKNLRKELELSYIFITHDLALASELADYVAVMYAGKIVEYGLSEVMYTSPKHPYTQKLLESVPTLRTDKKLGFIPGAPPDLFNPPAGCRFQPRCPYAMDICGQDPPPSEAEDHRVFCWRYAKR